MKIDGIVTDAIKEKPLAKSKVVLYIGEIELVTFYSDKDGKFEIEQKLDQYIGKTLICHVEKDKFNSRKVTYKIGEEDIRLNIELVPINDDPPIWERIYKWLKKAIAVLYKWLKKAIAVLYKWLKNIIGYVIKKLLRR